MQEHEVVSIGVLEADKDATSCFRNPSCTHPGAEIEILQMAFRLTGDPYDLVDIAANYNVANDLGELIINGPRGENRQWSGVMGLLVDDEGVDMSGITMRVTKQRNRDVLFSYPTRFFQSVFIIATPSKHEQRAFIFAAFSQTVWTILISLFAVAFLLQIVHVLVRRRIRAHQLGTSTPFAARTVVLILMLAWNKTFRGPKRCKVWSQCIYGAFFIISFFWVTHLYKSSMTTILFSPIKMHLPFTDMDGALEAVQSRSLFFTGYPKQALLCSTDKNCERFQQAIAHNPVRRRVREEQITEDLRFNKALLTLYPAVAQITTGHGYQTLKQPMETFVKREWSPITLFHLREAFVYYMVTLVVGATIFALEVLVHLVLTRYRRRRNSVPRIVIQSPSSSLDVEKGHKRRNSSMVNAALDLLQSLQFKPSRRDSFVP